MSMFFVESLIMASALVAREALVKFAGLIASILDALAGIV